MRKHLTSSSVIVILLGACGGSVAPAPRQHAVAPDRGAAIVAADMEDQIAYMNGFADEACACADATCAQEVDRRVRPKLVAETEEELYSDEDGARYQPAYHDRLAAAYGRYVQCLAEHDTLAYSFAAVSLWSFGRVADDACACTTVACAREVEGRLDSWKRGAGRYPATDADRAVITELAGRLAACLDVAYQGSGVERGQDALIALKELRTRGCACAGDDACQAEVRAEVDQWMVDYAAASSTERVTREIKEVATELFTCVPYLQPAVREALDEVAALRDRACACSTMDCADAVRSDVVALVARHQNTRAPDHAMAQFQGMYAELAGCVAATGAEPLGGEP